MNTSYLGALINNPSVFLGEYIVQSVFSVAFAYGLVWVVMRPKGDDRKKISGWWHVGGILATDLIASIFRVLAAATFAGKSAHQLNSQDSAIYLLIIPAVIAAIIIRIIKDKAKAKQQQSIYHV